MAIVPLTSPVPEALYPVLSVTLSAVGLSAAAGFFVYEVVRPKPARRFAEEAGLAAGASLALGFGAFFTLLWTGIYV